MSWEMAIGLEIHVQLDTRTKLFCACAATFGAPPNTHVCPVCLGLPGALPVPNRRAVELAVRAALGLGCAVHDRSVFARKQYFYPDLPKGYQITQYDRPLATGGALEIVSPDRGPTEIGFERIHLEEDAGKSVHDAVPGHTALDFNRAGTPLIEIVTRPDLRSPEEARAFLTALKQTLRYLEVSDCNMEEGSLRVDANGSIRRPGEALGTKQEVKNMNSFAAVHHALEQLREAQVARREAGDPVEQMTFSAASGTLHPMRSKETTEDYRYLPDPDLPPIDFHAYAIDLDATRVALPELPSARRARWQSAHGLSPEAAHVLSATPELADYYEAVVDVGIDPAEAANWIQGPVLADANAHAGALRLPPTRLAALIRLVQDGTVSRQAAARMLPELVEDPADPLAVAQRLGMVQVDDVQHIAEWVDAVLDDHPDEAARARAGDERVLDFLIGGVMRRSRGRADPHRVVELLRDRLMGRTESGA